MGSPPVRTGGSPPPVVLVVDDNPDDIVVLGIAAELLVPPVTVEVAESGDLALGRLRDGAPPAAVLLDWNLPGPGARAVLDGARLAVGWGAVPIVVYSGDDDPAVAAEALAHGAAAFEVKPVGVDAVASVLERVMALTEPA